MRPGHTGVVATGAERVGDFSPLIKEFRGSGGGAYYPGLGRFGTLRARPKRKKKPRSAWTYNEWVYVTVEALWNQLCPAQLRAWKTCWRPKCLSPRDYFGKWNHVMVGRFGLWLKEPPTRHLQGKLRFQPPGGIPIPSDLLPGLGGEMHLLSQGGMVAEQYFRSGFGVGMTKAAAWNAGWVDVEGKTWTKTTGTSITNAGYVYNYGYYWGATFYQAWTKLILLPHAVRAWVPWVLTIGGGWPGTGAKGLGFLALGQEYLSKGGTFAEWQTGWRTTWKGLSLVGGKSSGLVKPPVPVNPSQWSGVQSGFYLPEIYGR